MAVLTVRADGVDWPVDSFIDNYRMLRSDGTFPDFDGRDPLVDILTSDGEYLTRQSASRVDWGRVRAFASPELPMGGGVHKLRKRGRRERAHAQRRLL